MHSGIILFVGTFSPPVTGQSFSFETSYEKCRKKKIRVNKTPFGTNLFLKSLTHVFVVYKVLVLLLFKPISKVYMTTFSTVEGSVSDVMVLLLCRLFRKKTIVHLHVSNFKTVIQKSPSIYRKILVDVFSKVDNGIVLSNIMREQLDFLLPPEKIVVIENFYDPYLESIPTDFRESIHNSNVLKVGYLSNLVYSKGILHLVEALEVLILEGLTIELHVAGKYMGDEYMSSEAIREEFEMKLRNNPWIKYYGVVQGEGKVSFYKQTDLFVLPTFYTQEAQPICIIEAMRAGCIIISTKYRYIPDLITSKNGWLVQVKSIEDITYRIKEVLESSAHTLNQMRQYNIITAKNRYSLDSYLLKLDEVFESIESK